MAAVNLAGINFAGMPAAQNPVIADQSKQVKSTVERVKGAADLHLRPAGEMEKVVGAPRSQAKEDLAVKDSIPQNQPLTATGSPKAPRSPLIIQSRSLESGEPLPDEPVSIDYSLSDEKVVLPAKGQEASAPAGGVVQVDIVPPSIPKTPINTSDRSFLYQLGHRNLGSKIVYEIEKKAWSSSPKHTEGKQISSLKKVMDIGHKELKCLAADRIEGNDPLQKLTSCSLAYSGIETIQTNWDKKVKTLSCIKQIGIALYNFWPFSKSVPRMIDKIKKEIILKTAQTTNKEFIENLMKDNEKNDKFPIEFYKKVIALQDKLTKDKKPTTKSE